MLFQEIGGINNERAENQALLQQHFDMIFFTGGKTCVAPDYILCDKKIHDKLLSAILAEIDKQFGESGMGGYHGEAGFETFSHYRSIVDKKIWMDLPVRYQKYIEKKEKILRRFL